MSDSMLYCPDLTEDEYKTMVDLKEFTLKKAKEIKLTLENYTKKIRLLGCPTEDCKRCVILFPFNKNKQKHECPCERYTINTMIRRGNKMIQKYKIKNNME